MLKARLGWSRGFMQHHELYPLLGIKDHLPVEGFPEIQITYDGQSALFKCDPIPQPKTKRGAHRLKVFCKSCEVWIPFGKFGQHSRGRGHKQELAQY